MNATRSQSTGLLSDAASARKRSGLDGVLAAQRSRVRVRRLRTAVVAGVACLALTTALLWLPAAPSAQAPHAPVSHGPVSHGPVSHAQAPRDATPPAPIAPRPPSPPRAPTGPVIAVVANDGAALRAALMDERELQALLLEAGEPAGLVRVAGRAMAERELLIAAAGAPEAHP